MVRVSLNFLLLCCTLCLSIFFSSMISQDRNEEDDPKSYKFFEHRAEIDFAELLDKHLNQKIAHHSLSTRVDSRLIRTSDSTRFLIKKIFVEFSRDPTFQEWKDIQGKTLDFLTNVGDVDIDAGVTFQKGIKYRVTGWANKWIGATVIVICGGLFFLAISFFHTRWYRLWVIRVLRKSRPSSYMESECKAVAHKWLTINSSRDTKNLVEEWRKIRADLNFYKNASDGQINDLSALAMKVK